MVELTIATAASIAAWGLDRGYQVGLLTNGVHRLSFRQTVGVDPGADPAQLTRILETLGRLRPFATRPFETLLAESTRGLAFGTTVVTVSAVLSAPVASALVGLGRRGHPTVLVLTGRDPAPAALSGVVVLPLKDRPARGMARPAAAGAGWGSGVGG